MREQYLKHRDPKRAVVEGVGSTARVITSAALIMMAVFGAFILGSDVIAKMFGVGLAVAVFLDVTLVRMVLVPAAMSLLGHTAWWLPAGSTAGCRTSTSRATTWRRTSCSRSWPKASGRPSWSDRRRSARPRCGRFPNGAGRTEVFGVSRPARRDA